ncbi:MAG: hypothetical protein LH477_03710 [Nocardioides sp.]|nr:hypothetical protein [Nocardioides sp.]
MSDLPHAPWRAAVDAGAAIDVTLRPSDAFEQTGSGLLVVEVDGRRHDFDGEWASQADVKRVLRNSSARDEGRMPRLVVAPILSPRTASVLRDRGISFIDLAGNAFVRFDGVRVRASTTRPAAPELRALIAETDPAPSNLFTPARAQVVLVLVQWPELLRAPTREVAARAGVSGGMAHGTVKMLEERGYIRRARREPWLEADQWDNLDDLVDAWALAFPTGLWRRVHLRDYRSQLDSWAGESDPAISVGGEYVVAADVEPASVTLYVTTRGLGPATMARHRVMAAVEGEADTFVCRRFWTAPQSEADPRRVPWLLTYAELLDRGDARLAEAAGCLRRRAHR